MLAQYTRRQTVKPGDLTGPTGQNDLFTRQVIKASRIKPVTDIFKNFLNPWANNSDQF